MADKSDPRSGPVSRPYRTCWLVLEWNREPESRDCRECARDCVERDQGE